MSPSNLRPRLSVVVTVHDMPREAPRTLLSLSASYQRNIAAADYEVIVVDTGSSPSVEDGLLDRLGAQIRLIRADPSATPPASAVNLGLAAARGEVIGVITDGARIVTPGVLHFALHGCQLHEAAVVVSLGWDLGFDLQQWARQSGYTQDSEDRLLQAIAWPDDGYRLFEIGTPDEASADGWFNPIADSSTLFLKRDTWDRLGSMDQRWDADGRLFNRDIYRRALERPDGHLVVLLGEGSFRQLHDGAFRDAGAHATAAVTTGQPAQDAPRAERRSYIGTLPPAALIHMLRAATTRGGPLGDGFDIAMLSVERPVRPSDPGLAGLVELAQNEFRGRRMASAAAVARLIRSKAPDEPEALRILSHAGPSLRTAVSDMAATAHEHAAVGDAYRMLGQRDMAEREYRKALARNDDFGPAYVGMAKLRMPGEFYYALLRRFHGLLCPANYFEIGVSTGQSLALARPPTRAIGVDPDPRVITRCHTEVHVFRETSDAFFANGRLDAMLGGAPIDLAFIDGLHEFGQTLRDIANVERYCGPRSVVLVHDTCPADEITQRPHRERQFYTGDVWKIVPCLKEHRPDLDVFTIATPCSGLTAIIGFTPERRLHDDLEKAIGAFEDMPYAAVEHQTKQVLNLIPNAWAQVVTRLRRRGVLPMADAT